MTLSKSMRPRKSTKVGKRGNRCKPTTTPIALQDADTVKPTLQITDVMTCREAIMNADLTGDYSLALACFGAQTFVDEVLNLVEKKVDLSPAAKARIFAALWANNSRKEFDTLMFDVAGFFGTSELFKLVPIVDKPRRLRQVLARLEKIRSKAKSKTLRDLILEANELRKEPHSGSLTCSFSRRIAKWVGTLSEDTLSFQAINFPSDNWRAVSNACHLKPDNFQVAWFLPFCFGAPAPEGTLVNVMTTVSSENLATALRNQAARAGGGSVLDAGGQGSVGGVGAAGGSSLVYEDIVRGCAVAEAALHERLSRGELVASGKGRVNYPKLMERIMLMDRSRSPSVEYLMESASGMLEEITFPENDLKVAVFGDCSASMSVAVNTASILASIFTARLNTKLTFFNSACITPPVQPTTTEEVLTVAKAIQATCSTSPAACLYPYLKEKILMDLFIVVTDEEENMKCEGYFFAALFQEYLLKVNPKAQVFFVSFLSVREEGNMTQALASNGISAKQFRFDQSRPDLSKFDELLGLLTLQIQDDMKAKVLVPTYAAVAFKNVVPSAAEADVLPLTRAPAASETDMVITEELVKIDLKDDDFADGGWIKAGTK
ncbi:hypothetical protein BC830DRAFT_1077241 [Chytriomyces sp. MP71]|nr:hypothetical protein BC830DRAFT_1077241 [Chytriomyces sp. MP71]